MSDLAPATIDALNARFPDNPAFADLALMYAKVYEGEGAAIAYGLLMASQHEMHNEIRDIYAFLTPVHNFVQNYLLDPEGNQLAVKEAIGQHLPMILATMMAKMNDQT